MKRFLTVCLLSIVLSGCGDSFSPDGISGTYELTFVNGSAMPASVTVTDGGLSAQITFESGTLTLRGDGTYLFSLRSEITIGTATVTDTETDSGTFALQEPATIRITSSQDQEMGSGSVNGGTLTFIDDGITLVFEK